MSTTSFPDASEPSERITPVAAADSLDVSGPEPGAAMTPARQPVGTGPAPIIGLALALGLIALGVVGIQEALVRSRAIDASSWTTWVLTELDGVRAADWMVVLFGAVILLGLLLMLVVFRRRPRKTIALRAGTGVYLRTGDLARLADSLVEGTDGVIDVKTSASRSRLRIEVTTMEPKARNGALSDIVRERLSPVLAPLVRAPKVSVNVRNEDFA